MKKILPLLFLFSIFFISFSSASYGIGSSSSYGIGAKETSGTTNINYSTVNTNNSIYWNGYSWHNMSLPFFNSIWNYNMTIYGIYNYNQSTNVSGYVPYTGATSNVNLNYQNFSTESFKIRNSPTGNFTFTEEDIIGDFKIPMINARGDWGQGYGQRGGLYIFSDDHAIGGTNASSIIFINTYNPIAMQGGISMYEDGSFVISPAGFGSLYLSNGWEIDAAGTLNAVLGGKIFTTANVRTGALNVRGSANVTGDFNVTKNIYTALKLGVGVVPKTTIDVKGTMNVSGITNINNTIYIKDKKISIGKLTIPLATLDVEGTMNVSGITNINNTIYIKDKKISIGKLTIPLATLDVAGTINVSDNIKPNATSIISLGSSSLRWLKGWFVNLDVNGNTTLNNFNVSGKGTFLNNIKAYFGSLDQSSIYYNGSDMLINPKDVGTGKEYHLGDIVQTNGNATINNYYGSVYNFTDVGQAGGLTSSGVYYNLTISTSGELNGFKVWQSGALGTQLQALVSGYYSVDGVLSADFAGGEYGVGIVTNGANPEVIGRCYTRTTLSGENGLPITCMKRLVAGDNITMVVDDESTPTKDITIHAINMKAFRIGN